MELETPYGWRSPISCARISGGSMVTGYGQDMGGIMMEADRIYGRQHGDRIWGITLWDMGYGESLRDMGNHFIGYGRQHGESRPDMGGSMVTTGYMGKHFIWDM